MFETDDQDNVTLVDKLFHIAGEFNPADIATRGEADIADLDKGSEWQNGPKFLSQDRKDWPISREFKKEVPREERRNKFYSQFNLVKTNMMPKALTEQIKKIMAYSHSLTKVRGILARFQKILIE